MNVVIVESPAKAKTINKYLGSDYHVLASYGHVRDLPSKDGSVKPDEDFSMSWQVSADAKKRVSAIADAVKDADKLILATDPDREGEAISWHVLEILNQKKVLKDKQIQRVVFNAITKGAVLEAMSHPREIDQSLVEAYLARRALDYLVGFTLSPVLWRKLPSARSAGRVQSVALRLVCDRELEIETFKSQEYWTLEADMKSAADTPFTARLVDVGGEKLGKFDIPNEARATELEAAIRSGDFNVAKVESKPQKRNPYPPFTTSTLQQEASRKLGFSSSRTMQIAQKLYEGVEIDGETQGLITYMRTDGVQMAPEAISSARDVISAKYGGDYLPGEARVYKTKAKNAQEAHEAIRPVQLTRDPATARQYLDEDMAKLYELVWKRSIASQMESATIERTTVDIRTRGSDGVTYGLRANGSVIKFDGFLKLYQEDDEDAGDKEDAKRLPPLAEGERVSLEKITPVQHFTEPPPRYTEATLIKKMEELGIGRPSTYTSTLTVLRDREYVRLDKKRLVPEDKGRLVTAFLESFFDRYVEYDFTANLEAQLDKISAGELDWKQILRDFWRDFSAAVEDIADLRVSQVLDALNELLGPHVFPPVEGQDDPRACPACDEGRLSLKIGRYGAFIGCSNYPDCRFTRQLSNGSGDGAKAPLETKVLGLDPETGRDVSLHDGRFGPYVQLAPEEEGEKPKRCGLPRGQDPLEVTLELALSLLSLPREVGAHPETGKPIAAGLGRYGPFVQHERTYASLENFEEIFTVGLNRAVSLLAEKANSRRASASVIKELGEHPELGGVVQVMNGRYGPYVKHGKVNATLPKSSEPETVTMEQAVELIAAKAAKPKNPKRGGGKSKKAKEEA